MIFLEGMGVLLEAEIRGVLEVKRVKKTKVENQKGRKVKFLRPNNGGEYTSSKFKEYLVSEGIEHQLTIPGCLE